MTAGKEPDPLEGFRGKPFDSEQAMAEAVQALQSLREIDVDLNLTAAVLREEEVLAALREDTPLARIATHASQVVEARRNEWSESNDPTAPKMLEAHLEARAGMIVLRWIRDVCLTGHVARQQLNIEEEDDNAG